MAYNRDELIEIGHNWATKLLVDWARQIAGQARKYLTRLGQRGVTAEYLSAVERLAGETLSMEVAQERDKKEVPASTSQRAKAMAAAFSFREEVKGLAAAAFDSEPDILALFRTGVKVGRSTPKLIVELERILPVVREFGATLDPVGRGTRLAATGATVLEQLRNAQQRHNSEKGDVPPRTAELNGKKGDLYCRLRWLVRLGRVEFRVEPEKAALYNYDTLRRGRIAAKAAGTRRAQGQV